MNCLMSSYKDKMMESHFVFCDMRKVSKAGSMAMVKFALKISLEYIIMHRQSLKCDLLRKIEFVELAWMFNQKPFNHQPKKNQ